MYLTRLFLWRSKGGCGEASPASASKTLTLGQIKYRLKPSFFIYTDPFLPPDEININLSDLDLRQFMFSWSPVAPDCPAIHYNILASNCGSCPTTTNHTNVTCTDVPTEQNTFCAFALQTVVCGNITGILSNPISVSLSDDNVEREGIVSGNINDNRSDLPPIIFANGKCMVGVYVYLN